MQQQNRLRLLMVASLLISATIFLSAYATIPVSKINFSSVAPETVKDIPGETENNFALNTPLLSFADAKESVFDSLSLETLGLSRKVFSMALKGMEKLKKSGLVTSDILSIIDFSQSSNSKRLYIIDLDNYRLLFNTLVAHGRNSGEVWATSFSNKNRSKKSSLGFYITGEAYFGNNGYSLKLQGVETGINSNAQRRAIVVHGADYVSENYIQTQGYIGRSLGCPAIPSDICSSVIDDIKSGSCLFIYHPSIFYTKKSRLLK